LGVVLAVNFLVLILVSGAVRLGKAREHRLTADTSRPPPFVNGAKRARYAYK
jgi:hypothetical protein